jgi:hypothetical protein
MPRAASARPDRVQLSSAAWLPVRVCGLRAAGGRNQDAEKDGHEMETGLTASMPARLGESFDLVVAMHAQGLGGGEFLRREQPVWAVGPQQINQNADPLRVALYPQGRLFRKWAMEALDAARRPWRLAFVSHSSAAVEAIVAQGLAVTVLKATTFPSRLRALSERDGMPPLPAADICLHRATHLPRAAALLPDHLQAALAMPVVGAALSG